MALATRLADHSVEVTVGVDTHKELHVAAAFDQLGRLLDTASFTANKPGYQALAGWARGFGPLVRAGVEGTGSWGAGLARFLSTIGVEVIEVNRPNRQHRRRHGKSDPADAISAGRAVLSGEAAAVPKAGDGAVEGLRMLRIARRSADKARTQAANQIWSVIDNAPEDLRAQLRRLSLNAVVGRATRFRCGPDLADPRTVAKLTLRSLARRFEALQAERAELDALTGVLVERVAPPALLAQQGIGTQVAAALLIAAGDNPERLARESSFAALCGASPVDASSGKQQRHRLNRGGDRQANNALWRIVLIRLRYDPATREYVERRMKEGKTKREAMRCLKRYLARDIWRLLRDTSMTPIAAPA
jgi:transposase